MRTFKKILYWIVWCTWGLPITLIGGIVTLILLCTKHKPQTFCNGVYFSIGKGWGGFEMGPFFLVDSSNDLSLKKHERGHGNQWVFGPLFIFFVTIPSALRYWMRNQKTIIEKYEFVNFVVSSSMFLLILFFFISLMNGITWLWIICALLAIYVLILSIWMFCFEIPKYMTGEPDYDDFYIERWATESGQKTYKKYYN